MPTPKDKEKEKDCIKPKRLFVHPEEGATGIGEIFLNMEAGNGFDPVYSLLHEGLHSMEKAGVEFKDKKTGEMVNRLSLLDPFFGRPVVPDLVCVCPGTHPP